MFVLLFFFAYGLGAFYISEMRRAIAEDNKSSDLSKITQQAANDAWTKIGEREVELFLAAHTTPDDNGIVWPDCEQTTIKNIDSCVHITNVQLEEVCTYVSNKTGVAGSIADVLHALNPNTTCLPESWSGQVRKKVSELHTERNCPLGFDCKLAPLAD